MPQINRIRIINFTYNNNNRQIIDETFDFYQGENALLSLKNGGGKSVLVQLLFQPIIPKAKLMGRRIEDFFIGKKTPTYVLIEWKLEDKGGYLLTGIGLANRESQVRDQDEGNNSLKYFTFTSNYHKSNMFDIENVPLIQKQFDRLYIEDYKEARKMMASKEKDLDFKIRFFADEDRLEYGKHLASYNISQDEWQSIVLKINESEGGVIEIFEKCRTSQQLMNEWILKTVEKVVYKDQDDQKKLEQMLENLVEEMITNEQYIHEKDIYEGFLRQANQYLEKLNELVVSLDSEDELKRQISGLYYYLQNEINKMKKEKVEADQIIASSEKELNTIDLEERSKEFYDVLDRVKILSESFSEKSKNIELLRDKKRMRDRQALVQEAARDYEKIRILEQKLAGIKENINRIISNDDNNEKIKNLEFSLKTGYEKMLKDLVSKQSNVLEKKNAFESTLNSHKNRLKEIDGEMGNLQNKKGKVKGYIETFERNEKRIKNELQLTYARNLLGEIEKGYNEKYLEISGSHIADLNSAKDRASTEMLAVRDRIKSINEQTDLLRKDHQDDVIEFADLCNKINKYNSLESSLKTVLDKYNLDWSKRFNGEENQQHVLMRINELKRIENDLVLNIKAMRDNIVSLKNGTLHVSNEFRDFLINQDIAFETGENYLRKQSEEIRSNLISNNPMLPFSFILFDHDIESLQNMEVELSIYQMVPMLSYKEINSIYSTDGNIVRLQDNLRFMCLYDDRMIDADNLKFYLEELESGLLATEEQLAHYIVEAEKARNDLKLLKDFIFDKNYQYNLEEKKRKVGNKSKDYSKKMAELNDDKKNSEEKIETCREKTHKLERQLEKVQENINRFYEFVLENEEYIRNNKLYMSLSDNLNSLKKEKESIDTTIEDLNRDLHDILEQSSGLKREIQDAREKYQEYSNAQEGEIIHEDLGILEERVNALKSKIGSDLKTLQDEQVNKQKELNDAQLNLKDCNLEEAEYVDIVYDHDRLVEIKSIIRSLEQEIDKADNECRVVENELIKENTNRESAEKEIKRLGESPIDRDLIKLDFDIRRKQERKRISDERKILDKLSAAFREFQRIADRIEVSLDISNYQVDLSYLVVESPQEDYKKLIDDLKVLQNSNKESIQSTDRFYNTIRSDFKEKNQHISNIFKGLDSIIEDKKKERSKYYYLGERLLYSNDSLGNLIRVCDQKLSNLENYKNNMIQQSFLHGKQVYEEIQKIPENSSIKLDGKSRPMLKIDMVPLKDVDADNYSLMKAYIDSCTHIIKADMKEEKRKEDIRRKISKYMSTRELLNVLSDLGKMNIRAYKIDINMKNSKYKTWEQVMKENSGGERFVSFFSVLVALMSYTRTSTKFEDDYQRNKDTKVLIMDNPFGPISSEHLLKPLFDIATKYNTQLICLTDLKQSSILNCFNLIYMIKIRQSALGTNEYIQLERQIKEDADVEQDERLEKAVFKAKDTEQMRLV